MVYFAAPPTLLFAALALVSATLTLTSKAVHAHDMPTSLNDTHYDLLEPAERNMLNMLISHVNSGAHIDRLSDQEGNTPLYNACKHGYLHCAAFLLELGVPVDKATPTGYTPLHIACMFGYYDIAHLLVLNYRANVHARATNSNYTPLHCACKCGSKYIVKLLLDAGANTDVFGLYGKTPLIIACESGHLDIAHLLVTHNIDSINVGNKSGYLPLHAACLHGHLDIVQFLLDNGANINQAMISGRTPLYCACEKGDFELADFLLDNGAAETVNNQTFVGTTALHCVCKHPDNMYIIMRLSQCGADDTIANYENKAPFEYLDELQREKIYKIVHPGRIKSKHGKSKALCHVGNTFHDKIPAAHVFWAEDEFTVK